jgi:hypothetical protein
VRMLVSAESHQKLKDYTAMQTHRRRYQVPVGPRQVADVHARHRQRDKHRKRHQHTHYKDTVGGLNHLYFVIFYTHSNLMRETS